MLLPRRLMLQFAASSILFPAASRCAWAQAYPTRPVTFVVFAPAGGSPDIKARMLGQALSLRIGQPIIIENRPGAGGNLSLQAVARAPADGYTLLVVGTPHAINATLYDRLNVLRDIVPIAGIGGDPFVMLVNPSFPAKTLGEFIAYAKTHPGKINLTSSGVGVLSHLSGEMFRMMTGIDWVHVPYKGAVAAQADLVAGEVHVMFDALTSALPHIQSGKLQPLGVTSAKRVTSMPKIPAIAEFVPGYEVVGIIGVGAPKETPAAIIERLNMEINAVVADPALKERLVGPESTALAGTPAEFGRLIHEQAEKWAKVLRFAGIKAS